MRKLTVTLLAMLFCTALSSHAGLLENHSFEQDLASGWYVFDDRSGAEVTRSTDQALDPDWSLKVATTSHTARVQYDVVTATDNMPAVTPGDEYSLDGNYYCPQSLLDDEAFGVGLFWYKVVDDEWVPSTENAGDWKIVYGPDADHDTGEEFTNQWKPITDTDTAPTDAEYLQVGIQVQGRGSTLYFDDMQVVPEPFSIGLLLIAAGGIFAGRRFRRRLRH